MNTAKTTKVAAGLIAIVALLATPALAGKSQIFELVDPRGDDHGDGSLIYPLRTDFTEGELDLVRFSARRVNRGTMFEATFARPIRPTEGQTVDDIGTQLDSLARFGFYNLNIDVYIDTDREFASGAIATMPGREVEVKVEEAWDRAVIVTPRPHNARAALEREVLTAMNKQMLGQAEESGEPYDESALKKTVPTELADRVFFPTRIHARGRTLSFFVPDTFFGGPARADWSYVVAVSGADLIQRFDLSARAGLAATTRDKMNIVPVSSGSWQNRFGTSRSETHLMPPLVDIIVPEGASQEKVLADFNGYQGRPAVLPGVTPDGSKKDADGP